jgi:hypothetical protein
VGRRASVLPGMVAFRTTLVLACVVLTTSSADVDALDVASLTAASIGGTVPGCAACIDLLHTSA